MKKIFTLLMIMSFSLYGMAYDFEYNNCYYEITSIADRTVTLINAGNTAYSFNTLNIPTTVEYSNMNFTVTAVNASFNCRKITIYPNVLTASLSGSIDSLIVSDSKVPMNDLYARGTTYAYIGRDIIVPWNHLQYVFSYSNSLRKIEFGDDVTYIPGSICSECNNLEEVVISDNVKAIYNEAFANCPQLISISGQGIETLETHTFTNCTSLSHIDFPSLKIIEDGDSQRWGVFQGCTSLQKVILPAGLEKIGHNAFKDCSSLDTIVIPSTISEIGRPGSSYVFDNCPNLSVISIGNTDTIAIDETTFNPLTYLTATLKVPVGCRAKYASATNWRNFANIVEDPSIVSNQHGVSVYCGYEGGAISVNGNIISNEKSTSFVATTGESVTIYCYPETGYCVGSVLINDEEYVNQVTNNQLTLTISQNTSIRIYFYEEPIYLSIKQADNGCVKIQAYEYAQYNLLFEASAGWEIHSVTYNGMDVTSNVQNGKYLTPYIIDNSEIVVTYISEATNINYVPHDEVRVWGQNGIINVGNTNSGETISIYTVNGMLVTRATTIEGIQSFNVTKNNVYIVKIGDISTYKLAL